MTYNPYKEYCGSWWRYWLNLPGDLCAFVKRVYDYLPLLWEDEDYDFNATLRLMRFKLLRLRRHMEGHKIIAHAEDVVAELARTDVLLRNIVEEDPDDEWSLHWNQWHAGVTDLNDCKNKRECRRANQASFKRNERNWHRLWRYLDKHARGFWD